MSSDEDPPFSFMCEGPPSVLGIFGESSGGLSMNSGTSRTELDVYVKSSSIPVELSSQEEGLNAASKEKDFASENIPSRYSKEECDMSLSEDDEKKLPSNSCPVSEKEDKHSGEIADVEATVRNVCTSAPSKAKQECLTEQVSVELPVEIMEVLENSKSVSVSDNSISKLESCQGTIINDSQSLQEELDSLEQLAMERVCEIESELANSKQIVSTKLDSNLSKQAQDIHMNKTLPSMDSSSNIELLGSVDADNLKEDLLDKDKKHNKAVSSSSTIPLTKCVNFLNKNDSYENDISIKCEDEVVDSVLLKCEKMYQSSSDTANLSGNEISSNLTLTSACTSGLKENNSNLSLSKVNDFIQCSRKDKLKIVNQRESTPVILEDEKIVDLASAVDIDSKTFDLSDDVNSNFQTSVMSHALSNIDKKLSQSPSSDGNKDCSAQFDDLKNYETDDDDLKVLEAFIVKSATNPEIAICSTKQIEDNAIKYSLESALLDDLTKTDNENESNLEVAENKEGLISSPKSTTQSGETALSMSVENTLSHELQQASRDISEVLNNSLLCEFKTKTNGNPRRQMKQKSVCCTGKLLPLKKRFTPRKMTELDECVNVKGEDHDFPLKGIVPSVKRGRGRPLGSGKKPKHERNIVGKKPLEEKDLDILTYPQKDSFRDCFVIIENEKKLFNEFKNTSTSSDPKKDKFCISESDDESDKNDESSVSLKKDFGNRKKRRIPFHTSVLSSRLSKKKRKIEDTQLNCSSTLARKGNMERNRKKISSFITSRNLRQGSVYSQISMPSRNILKKNKDMNTASCSVKNKTKKNVTENFKFSSLVQKRAGITKNEEYLVQKFSLHISLCSELTYDLLQSKVKEILLPSSLWSVQVDMGQNCLVFLRTCTDLSESTFVFDKALVFQESLKPLALIYNELIDLPLPSLQNFEDVVLLIQNFNDLSLCEGTGIKQRARSKYCYRYIDVANAGHRCSQCLEERRRVLSCYARKLREKIMFLEKP